MSAAIFWRFRPAGGRIAWRYPPPRVRDRRAVREVRARSRRGSAPTSPRCSSSSPTAGRTAPAWRSIATRRRPGSTKVTLYSPDPGEDWDAVAAALARRRSAAPASRRVRATHACIVVEAGRGRGRALGARGAPRPARDERRVARSRSTRRSAARRSSRGSSRSTTSAARTPSGTRGWRPRVASRRRRRTRSPPASTSASCTTGRSRTTTGCGCALRREGIPFRTDNDTEVAAGYLAWRMREGATLEAGARGLPRRPRRLLHVPRRHRRRLRRAPRPDRVQAGCARGDGRLGRDGLRVPRDRRPAGRRGRARLGAEPGRRLRLGASRRVTAVDRTPPVEAVETVDLAVTPLRELNQRLHDARARRRRARAAGASSTRTARTRSPAASTPTLDVEIEGHAGYYCAGMNKRATVRVRGSAGTGVAENMMSGRVVVEGNASQSAGATAHGGLLVVHGDASARCAISLKGADVVVRGSVGHMSAFMAQTGRLVVCGDAGEALGDSIYEARLYVAGDVAGARGGLRREGDARRARRRGARAPRAGADRRRRPRLVPALRLGAHGSTPSTSTTRTDGRGRRAVPHPRAARPPRVVPLRPRDDRRDPARRAGGDLRHPRLRGEAAAAALRRPPRARREHLPVPARGVSRAVRDERHARHPVRVEAARAPDPGHDRRA